MRLLASRHAVPLAVITLALAVPRAADARVQGQPECPWAPSPAPNTSYSCNFKRMPLYNASDPNLAFMSIPCDLYGEEIYQSDGLNACGEGTSCPDLWQTCQGNDTCSQPVCGSPTSAFPYAQSWLPYGPVHGDIGAMSQEYFYLYSIDSGPTAEAMALDAALAYRSPTTAIAGQYCTSKAPCPSSYTCNSSHACVPTGAYCDATTNCATGYTCNGSHACVVSTCSSTTPCPTGYSCNSSSACVPVNPTANTCSSTVPCPTGYTCDSSSVCVPTAAPNNPTGTAYTLGFYRGAHSSWAWNCASYTTVGAALGAVPRGFLGGCMGGAPVALWPGSYEPGASNPSVFGLQQIAHMAILTNLEPDFGYVSNAGSYTWDYGQSFQPFAAEMYDNASDRGACLSDSNCASGYCMASPGVFFDGGPGYGTCASGVYQDLVGSSSSSVGISTTVLRAAIDRGGTGVVGQGLYMVKITPGSPAQMTFTPGWVVYTALQGYTVSYDQYTNPTLTFTFNNPLFGTQQTTALVDVANGTYTIGGQSTNVTLPNDLTNAVIWPVAADGSGKNLQSVTNLQNEEYVWIGNVAHLIYVQ